MNTTALLVFVGIIIIFVLLIMYIFSRLRAIRMEGDAANLMMLIYLVVSTIIVIVTLLFLVRP